MNEDAEIKKQPMKNLLVIGDSYSAAREGDTGKDGGWSLSLYAESPLTVFRQAVSGSTAAQWANGVNGMLDTSRNLPSDVLVMSLLGNDAFAVEPAVTINPAQAATAFLAAYADLMSVMKILKRKESYILIYPDAFNGARQDYNYALPILNGFVEQAAFLCGYQTIDLRRILAPSDFNGTDIHPIASGHAKIADYVKNLIA